MSLKDEEKRERGSASSEASTYAELQSLLRIVVPPDGAAKFQRLLAAARSGDYVSIDQIRACYRLPPLLNGAGQQRFCFENLTESTNAGKGAPMAATENLERLESNGHDGVLVTSRAFKGIAILRRTYLDRARNKAVSSVILLGDWPRPEQIAVDTNDCIFYPLPPWDALVPREEWEARQAAKEDSRNRDVAFCTDEEAAQAQELGEDEIIAGELGERAISPNEARGQRTKCPLCRCLMCCYRLVIESVCAATLIVGVLKLCGVFN